MKVVFGLNLGKKLREVGKAGCMCGGDLGVMSEEEPPKMDWRRTGLRKNVGGGG